MLDFDDTNEINSLKLQFILWVNVIQHVYYINHCHNAKRKTIETTHKITNLSLSNKLYFFLIACNDIDFTLKVFRKGES